MIYQLLVGRQMPIGCLGAVCFTANLWLKRQNHPESPAKSTGTNAGSRPDMSVRITRVKWITRFPQKNGGCKSNSVDPAGVARHSVKIEHVDRLVNRRDDLTQLIRFAIAFMGACRNPTPRRQCSGSEQWTSSEIPKEGAPSPYVSHERYRSILSVVIRMENFECVSEAQISSGRRNLTKAPQILKAFRQSVLTAACSRRLTIARTPRLRALQ